MKKALRFVFAFVAYSFFFFVVMCIVFAFTNRDEQGMLLAMAVALVATFGLRYFLKNRKSKAETGQGADVPAIPKSQADAASSAVRKIIEEIENSDNPFKLYNEKADQILQLKNGGATITSKEFADIRRAIARGFGARREVPPQSWNCDTDQSFPFVLQRNESGIYVAPYKRSNTYKNERSYQAGSRGIGIHVAKGVSFRLGRIAGKSVTEEVPVDTGSGYALVTNKNFYYFVNDEVRKMLLTKIVGVEAVGKYLTITPDGSRAKPIEFVFKEPEDAKLLSDLIKVRW